LALVGLGMVALRLVPLDAVPDLSDTQVIVFSRWDRAPDIVEDQVTYPIVTALLGTPRVKAVRAVTDFGASYVYIVFEDGTDLYWARSRVLEYLSKIQARLPEGVRTELGPDATSVGWVYQYALVDDSGRLNLADLRSLQDWYLRYQLQSVPGVAEVASIGGFVRQYQVQVLPNALHAFRLELSDLVRAVRQSNGEVGGGLLEFSGTQFMVRSKGYLGSTRDIEHIALGRNPQTGGPLFVKDVALVRQGPELRRGVADLNGRGDAVGGIVVMRYGEDVLPVIERIKAKLAQLQGSLPPGVRVITTYDRSDLIRSAKATLQSVLSEELVIVSLVILIFLWHIPSALVPIVTIPVAVLIAYIPMLLMGASSNLMSLSGIAISIGVPVDGAIIEVENACKKLELWDEGGRKEDFNQVRLAALKEVGPSVFFSLLVIATAFLPVFALSGEEGRLFRPLACTKTLVMMASAVLAVTFNPALRMALARRDAFRFRPVWASWLATQVFVGRYYKEEDHPVSRPLLRLYRPVCESALAHPGITLLAAGGLLATAMPVFMSLGSEFMPPLNEGSIFYMPTTLPGVSITEAQRVLQLQDRILRSFPEVESVFGKAGRADTPTDPAPLSMFETTIILKSQSRWRRKQRWYSSWAPRPFKAVLGRLWPETISYDELLEQIDDELKFPGFPNIWSHPIRARNDMLSTGVRGPVGIKVFGPDLKEIERLAREVERAAAAVSGTRNVFAERVAAGSFVDFTIRRDQLARYGLSLADVQDVIMTAVGGANVATAMQGRERYSVQVRYARDFRDELDKLKNIRVGVPADAQIPGSPGVPLGELAEIHQDSGPSMIRDENGMLTAYVFVDVAGPDLGSYVRNLKSALARVRVPSGYSFQISGQYESLERVRRRLKLIVPLTLGVIVLLLYLNTGSWAKTGIVLLAVPFSAVGAVWLMKILGYHLSIASWIGMVALMGLDAETGVFMLLYLDLAYQEAVRAHAMATAVDLHRAVVQGAVKRLRPKMMTVTAAIAGLLPISVVDGGRCGHDEADCGSDGRGPGDELSAGVGGLPGPVRHVEASGRILATLQPCRVF
jgi:Cu(I)/Ag(I) efflux system membrane protein CusA/SilA